MTRPAPHRVFLPLLLLAAVMPSTGRAAEEVPLKTAAELRRMSVKEAERGERVRVRGVVVFVENSAVFVRDESGTTFFRPRPEHVVSQRDVVEVIGPTRMGLYLPGIALADTVSVLGTQPLPDPIPVTFDDMAMARYHYQHVAVEGVVRFVRELAEDRSLMRLASNSRVLDVRIDAPVSAAPALVDARVRVSGLAAGFINDRRQVVQTYVRLQTWADVTVLEPPLPPASVPRLSAADLLAYRPDGPWDRRIGIDGTVTAAFPDGELYLRQGDIGFAARLVSPGDLGPGDVVELLGFPEMTAFGASVGDAAVVRRIAGRPPVPIEVGSVDALERVHRANLLAVKARISERFETPSGVVLALQGKERTLQAHIHGAADDLEPDSIVRVVGVCLAESRLGMGFASHVGTMTLRVRSADDVVVLQSPPWWTVRRLGLVLLAVLGLTAAAGLWIWVLRRQVRRQTQLLRRRIEAEAAVQERQRISREFHDSLEQELAGVSLRLDALATRITDEKGRHLVAASRNLVSRIQTETRDLISDLRDPAETAGDLVAVLRQVAARQGADYGIRIVVAAEGARRVLPAATVHDLRMIAREAITNAWKHGGATEVQVRLAITAETLVLSVADNGCGFDPRVAGGLTRGHFGCAGMRERARKLGAAIQWRAGDVAGTIVELTMPLKGIAGAGSEKPAESCAGSSV